jgi:hypothetical protein
MNGSEVKAKAGPSLLRFVIGYFAIGVAFALVYLLHSGLGVADMLLHLPIGWATMAGFVVAWPVLMGSWAWFYFTKGRFL